MQGLSFASLKKHPALIPLYICLAAGCGMATLYTLRIAIKNPDVMWNRSKDPNEDYRSKQYKFFDARGAFKNYECPAPDFEKKE